MLDGGDIPMQLLGAVDGGESVRVASLQGHWCLEPAASDSTSDLLLCLGCGLLQRSMHERVRLQVSGPPDIRSTNLNG